MPNIKKLGRARYPVLLSNAAGIPAELSYRAESEEAVLECLSKPTVAVVGSRSADLEGITLAREFGRGLAEAGCMVVSGLAIGIDAAAHEGALASGIEGATVAVLAHGLHSIYPKSNERLGRRIIDQCGVLFSPYDVGVEPRPHRFLERNAIIAGLAMATVVVQAKSRSGALNTARHALSFGREVLCVPGPALGCLHDGCHALIREGATLVSSPGEVLEEFDLMKSRSSDISKVSLCPILQTLSDEKVHRTQASLRFSDDELGKLFEYELNGRIDFDAQGYFRVR